MGDRLGEDDALASKTSYIVVWTLLLDRKSCPFQPSQKPVAGSIRHQVVMSEGYEENEGGVIEFDAHSCKNTASKTNERPGIAGYQDGGSDVDTEGTGPLARGLQIYLSRGPIC